MKTMTSLTTLSTGGGSFSSSCLEGGSTPSTASRSSDLEVECSVSPFCTQYDMKDRVLGTGAGGAVREAVCKASSRSVAVKSYHKPSMRPKDLHNLRSEMQVLTGLSHPSIMKVEGAFEEGEENDMVYLVLERLHGGELFDRLVAKGHFEEGEAAETTRQVLEALVYLHGQGVMHRDVKLENIMYEAEGSSKVRLIDFGYACGFSGPTSRNRCGTVGYVAPEVLRGEAYTEKVDMWSVGCILFAMLTGRPPFMGDMKAILKKNRIGHVDGCAEFWNLPQDARIIIQKLVAINPESRPSASEALQEPWLQRCCLKEVAEAGASKVRAASEWPLPPTTRRLRRSVSA